LKKVICSDPYQIAKQRTPDSYESDIIYTKKYILDKINIKKTNLRWLMIDIENNTDELPDVNIADKEISCITVYDNYSKSYKTFDLFEYKN